MNATWREVARSVRTYGAQHFEVRASARVSTLADDISDAAYRLGPAGNALGE